MTDTGGRKYRNLDVPYYEICHYLQRIEVSSNDYIEKRWSLTRHQLLAIKKRLPNHMREKIKTKGAQFMALDSANHKEYLQITGIDILAIQNRFDFRTNEKSRAMISEFADFVCEKLKKGKKANGKI